MPGVGGGVGVAAAVVQGARVLEREPVCRLSLAGVPKKGEFMSSVVEVGRSPIVLFQQQ